MAGKFTIFQGKDGQFYWNLKAGNGEIVGRSEAYKAKQSAQNGIEATQREAAKGERFSHKEGNGGKWYFNLKAGNGEIICASQGYASEDGAEKGIEACKRAAEGAAIVDETAESSAA